MITRQIRPWTDDELDALDQAQEAAKSAEGWLDELQHDTLGNDGPAVRAAQMLAWELRGAIDALRSEQDKRQAEREQQENANAIADGGWPPHPREY